MRRRRIFTAKRGFTAWALIVFAFLYLPIAVVVIFAFNGPSASSLASSPTFLSPKPIRPNAIFSTTR